MLVFFCWLLVVGEILNPLFSEPAVVVLGGAVVDVIGHPSGKLIPHTSNPGSLKLSIGGVGRNIAEGLARLGTHTKLLSIVGMFSEIKLYR